MAGQSELQVRTAVGIALICVAVAALLAGGPIFWMLLSAAGVLMMGEWADLVGAPYRQKRLAMFAVSVPLAILSPWAAGPGIVASGTMAGAALFLLAISRSAALAAGIAYVALPVMALLFLRIDPPRANDGLLLTFWVLSLVWATDICAYFAGRTFGGPKLAPRVSPSKTWSGLAGGVAGALLLGLALYIWAGLPADLAAASGLLAVLAQLGDLFESWLKRRAGVKDSSSLLPGHGGVMDRLDGVVAVAPAAALLLLWMTRP